VADGGLTYMWEDDGSALFFTEEGAATAAGGVSTFLDGTDPNKPYDDTSGYDAPNTLYGAPLPAAFDLLLMGAGDGMASIFAPETSPLLIGA